ncbi:MAG: helix-turn-helix transcriptional regulator [Rhodospirillales bacterium]|nr:helix-turn-helix transcriptional regulator [Rhodospirillales bacterium]
MSKDPTKETRNGRRGLDEIDLAVAARLHTRRLQVRLDTRLVDFLIGESPGTVEKLETGQRRIGAAHLYRLANVLGVDVAYFYTGPISSEESFEGEVPVVTSRMLTEAHEFARVYAKLPDDEVRRTVRNMVKTLAEGSSEEFGKH